MKSCVNNRIERIKKNFFTDLVGGVPSIETRSSLIGLLPIDRVAELSDICETEVNEYEENTSTIKIISETLQSCILKSQCKFIKLKLFSANASLI